jgi:predicted DNA-binding transcriptional regulator YafY
LALDRIKNIEIKRGEIWISPTFDMHTFYSDVIGVSKSLHQKALTITLKIDRKNFPYIQTKPIHHSQKVLKEEKDHIIFTIRVVWNFELEREILGFGEAMEILGPRHFKNKMIERYRMMYEKYILKK